MNTFIKKCILVSGFMLLIAAPAVTVALPVTSLAAGSLNCEKTFLGIPPWYRGLTDETTNAATGRVECPIKSPAAVVMRMATNGTLLVFCGNRNWSSGISMVLR